MVLSVCGVYPQYRAVTTLMAGVGVISGDWELYRKVNLKLSMIEPVAEGMFQLICQCIILYIVNGPGESSNNGEGLCRKSWNLQINYLDRPVVLTSLLYEETLHSKLVYAFFFSSSFVSVCTSFSTMLYKGENRLLTNIFSLTFVKIIIMTATKFIIQSLLLSIAIKSLMYKFVSKYQYFPPHTEDNELFRDLEEHYYRGLAEGSEVLTFTEATLILPLVMIAVLYLPSIFYVTYTSLQFYGKEKWSNRVLADPVYFIFPIFTCISFYHRNDKIIQKKEIEHKENIESDLSSEEKKEMDQTDQTGSTDAEIGNASAREINIIQTDVDVDMDVEDVDVEAQIHIEEQWIYV